MCEQSVQWHAIWLGCSEATCVVVSGRNRYGRARMELVRASGAARTVTLVAPQRQDPEKGMLAEEER